MPIVFPLWTATPVTMVGAGLTVTDGEIAADAVEALVSPVTITADAPQTVASISVASDATNMGIAISPKGFGAFMLDVPDDTSAGGNARGLLAVDLQLYRTAATQVASGSFAVAAGYSNTAGASNAIAIGANNNVSAENGCAYGGLNTISATFAVAVGNSNNLSASYCIGIGLTNTVSGVASIAIGRVNTVAGVGSVGFGYYTNDRGNSGQVSFGASTNTGSGRYQTERHTLWNNTSGSSAVRLTSTGAAVAAGNVAALADNSVQSFSLELTIFNTVSGEYSTWYIQRGAMSRGAGVATTALSAGTTAMTQGPSSGTPPTLAANPTLTADTTNGGYNLSYTPPAGNSSLFRAIGVLNIVNVVT